MKKIVIIDIGSNSVRLILVRIEENGAYKIINDLKESVRLEEGMDSNNRISEKYLLKAINTLQMFKNLCEAVEADEIIAVATEAVRKASNQKEFLDRIKNVLGIDVVVLSGNDEAFYDFIAVRSSIQTKNALIVDIGGGSTEIILMRNHQIAHRISLPFGSVNLSRRFKLQDTINSEQETALKFYLFEHYRKIPWLSENCPKTIIGIGGTIRNIGEIDRLRKKYPIDITHYYQMKNTDIKEIYAMARSRNLSQRLTIPGLSKSRADIFVGAACALNVLQEYCNVNHVITSGCGLREGLLFSYLQSLGLEITDPLDCSIDNAMSNFYLNQKHSQKIYKLMLSICRQLQPLHNLNAGFDNIVKTSALLHDCGVSVSYYNHHTHSQYMILNSGLYGLTHRELLMSSYIAGTHRKHGPKLIAAKYKLVLNTSDIEAVEKLGVLLSLAESFDRNMSSIIDDVKCEITDNKVTMTVISSDDAGLELSDAMQFRSSFKKAFGKELVYKEVRHE